MKAKAKYEINSKRCDEIIQLFKELNGNPKGFSKGTFQHKDLLRAVIVLKVAAMDSYFTGKFLDILVPFLKTKGATKRLSDLIQESGITFQEALNLMQDREPFFKIERNVENKVSRYVTQSISKIDNLFLCYGIKDISKNAQKLSGNNRLLENIDTIVKRRHFIVHESDLNKNGTIRNFKVNNFLNKFRDIDRYIVACDTILDKVLEKEHYTQQHRL